MLIEYGLKHIKLYHLYILYHIALSGILKKNKTYWVVSNHIHSPFWLIDSQFLRPIDLSPKFSLRLVGPGGVRHQRVESLVEVHFAISIQVHLWRCGDFTLIL